MDCCNIFLQQVQWSQLAQDGIGRLLLSIGLLLYRQLAANNMVTWSLWGGRANWLIKVMFNSFFGGALRIAIIGLVYFLFAILAPCDDYSMFARVADSDGLKGCDRVKKWQIAEVWRPPITLCWKGIVHTCCQKSESGILCLNVTGAKSASICRMGKRSV